MTLNELFTELGVQFSKSDIAYIGLLIKNADLHFGSKGKVTKVFINEGPLRFPVNDYPEEFMMTHGKDIVLGYMTGLSKE